MTSQVGVAPRYWKESGDSRTIVTRIKALPWARIAADAVILLGMLAISSNFLISK